MDNKTQSLHTIRYNACQIKIECVAQSANLSNYDYLLNLAKRMDAIAYCIQKLDADFENEPVANLVATSISKAMTKLIPSYGLGDFDWAGVGEDLSYLVHMAWVILRQCDEDGMAQAICDRHNLFTTMCEMQERLDEQWLTDLSND
jgi:hypothetical protein